MREIVYLIVLQLVLFSCMSEKDRKDLFFTAVENNDIELVNKYLENGIKVNCRKDPILRQTALMLAARNGNMKTVKFLLKKGASVNVYAIDSVTPLMYAVFNNHVDVVMILVAAGAEINHVGLLGTALMSACQQGNYKISKFLISKGADVNLLDSLGDSNAMWHAINNHNLAIVKLLILKGAKVNFGLNRLGFKMTPLMTASRLGYLEIAKYLIKKGANANIAYKRPKRTALSLARKGGHLKVVKFLKSIGMKK